MDQILSVSELARVIQRALESAGQRLSFTGEISQITRASSGHLYFTIKDSAAQLSAVMWKGMASSLDFVPKEGAQVVCTGTPNFYPPNGRLQVIVERMHLAGEGALRVRFEKLKQKLEAEGLFDAARKRPLPFLPRRVGIITSKSGAVIHDISVTIWERMPNTQLILYDARVQGEGAAAEIAAGIECFNRQNAADVLIVARGGGSLEDLWAFNEEVVSRAVFASRIPVVSAVGHEVDVSLSDFVADLRAPTPTYAAKAVVPVRAELLERIRRGERVIADTESLLGPKGQLLDELSLRLSEKLMVRLRESALQLEYVSETLRRLDPHNRLNEQRQRLRAAEEALQSGVARKISTEAERLGSISRLLERFCIPREQVINIERLEGSLSRGLDHALERPRSRLKSLAETLAAVGPQSVLKRGFALLKKSGRIVTDIEEIASKSTLEIELARGYIDAEVLNVKRK